MYEFVPEIMSDLFLFKHCSRQMASGSLCISTFLAIFVTSHLGFLVSTAGEMRAVFNICYILLSWHFSTGESLICKPFCILYIK